MAGRPERLWSMSDLDRLQARRGFPEGAVTHETGHGRCTVLAFVGSLVSLTLAAWAFAHRPVPARADEDPEKVVFTWASTGEPSSLNPMSGYTATDFYFWAASYHLLVDFDQDLGA